MANLNKEMCDCMGFYDPSGGCMPYDPEVHSEEPCPGSFWETAAGWDWGAISDNAMNWGYALGIFRPPNQNNLSNQLYMQELQRQRQQMTYIFVGLGVAMLVILLVVLRKK